MGCIKKEALGAVVKSTRLKMKLTQEELAVRVEIGSRAISGIENEEFKPSFEKLCELIWTLGIDANDIFYPESSEKKTLAIQRLIHLQSLCDERDLNILTALVEALHKF